LIQIFVFLSVFGFLFLAVLWLLPPTPQVFSQDIFEQMEEIVSSMESNLNQLEQNNEELKHNMSNLETTIQEKETLITESEQLLKTVQESYSQMSTTPEGRNNFWT
jgi:cell division protein FtsB